MKKLLKAVTTFAKKDEKKHCAFCCELATELESLYLSLQGLWSIKKFSEVFQPNSNKFAIAWKSALLKRFYFASSSGRAGLGAWEGVGV